MISRTGFVSCAFRCRWFFVAALFAGFCPGVWADPTVPGPNDRHITKVVVSMLKQHLTRHPFDAEISERCLKKFLETLDPMKLYFYQSDVDQFQKSKNDLCEAIARGDVSFAYTVFRVFLERMDERLQMVEQLLAQPLDFTVDEQMATDPDLMEYARDPAEAMNRWRQRIKFDLLVLKGDEKDNAKQKKDKLGAEAESAVPPASEKQEPEQAVDKLRRRYRNIAKLMHQTSNGDLLEMYLNAFTSSFDPHTDYMSPDTQKDFDIAMSLELEGIGASLMNDDGYTVVKEIVPGGAADKDGRLKVDDKIVGVGQGDEGEIVDVVGMKLRNVVKLIRGAKNTAVRLEVIPDGVAEHKVYKIVREKIELKNHEAKGTVFDVGRKPGGAPYRIGVIDLPSFYHDADGDRRGDPNARSTTRDVLNILESFKRNHVDAVVLDLRRNGGGFLNEAVSLTGLFIDTGPVVQVKSPDGIVQPLNDEDPGVAWSGPLVVLISKFSASASEILAGAIQDYHRGLIVGDYATHGKGTVQTLQDVGQRVFFGLPNPEPYGALKITTAQFYRPNGDSTQKRGVQADIELPSLTTHLDVGEADLDYPVEFDQVEPSRYAPFNDVDPALCAELRRLSQQRVQNSEEFQKVLRKIARYKEQKARKFITLNEEKFLKERAELDADKEEENALEKRDLTDNEIKRTFYLDEAMAIAADLLTLQQLAHTQPQPAVGANN